MKKTLLMYTYFFSNVKSIPNDFCKEFNELPWNDTDPK